MAVTADPQLLASAVTNLLNNAFKYTAPGGRVVLRATTNDEAHLLIDIEDECGGIPESEGDPFQSFGKRRGRDRSGRNGRANEPSTATGLRNRKR